MLKCGTRYTYCSRTTTEVILSTLLWDYNVYLWTDLAKHYHDKYARGILTNLQVCSKDKTEGLF